jgi:hypothetical protein
MLCVLMGVYGNGRYAVCCSMYGKGGIHSSALSWHKLQMCVKKRTVFHEQRTVTKTERAGSIDETIVLDFILKKSTFGKRNILFKAIGMLFYGNQP